MKDVSKMNSRRALLTLKLRKSIH